uniref:Carboxylesterase type B domain-containing protein n=1 Tax=Plectus sambesii TaxID=2011161 RepID=A0A914V8J1_9BILA
MGHSSGSMSVGLLSMSPMKNVAGHLFHQGIPMSGPPSITKDTNVQATFRLAEHAQCATKEHWDDGHFEPIIDCLRNKSALELLAWQRTIEEQDGAGFFGPSIDGPNGLFPADVPTMMKSRPAIPYMTGTTSKEFTFPLPIPDQVLASEQAYRAACKMTTSALGFSNVDAVADACTNYYSKTKILASEMMSEMFFVGTFKDAQSVRDAGAPVYLYSFDYPKISFHSADLGFVMGIHTIEQDATDDKLEIIYSGYFANFARVGRPADEWQPMKVPDGSNYFSIDYSDSNGTKVRPHNVDSYHPDTMGFWLVEAPKIDASSRNNQTTTTTKSTTTTASNDRKSTTTATTTQRVQPATKAVRNGDRNEAKEAAQEVRSEKIVKAEPVVSSAASNWETAFWVAICGCIALSLVFVVMGTLRLFKAKRAPHIIADERTSLLHDYRNGSVKQVY